MGLAPKRIPHWEHWSCPDAETALTGINYYDHPRLCREKMAELYPELMLPIPADDTPKPRPDGEVADGGDVTRWGDQNSGTWVHGEAFFKTAEDVFAFSPLEKGDRTGVIETSDHCLQCPVCCHCAGKYHNGPTIRKYQESGNQF
jgi:hypothetical protein